MFHVFTAFGAILAFFALTWHDQSAKPVVIERRPVKKQPAQRQAVENKNVANTTSMRRSFAVARNFPELAHSPNLKSK